MLLALSATVIVIVALLWEVGWPVLREQVERHRARRQLDEGLWAAVPQTTNNGRREAQLVRSFDEVPRDAERVIFFPPAAGGAR